MKIFLNLAIFCLVVGFVWYIILSVNNDKTSHPANVEEDNSFISSHEKIYSFELPEEINRFELYDGQLFISAGQSVRVYDTDGIEQHHFRVKPDVRDITAEGGKIYLLYPSSLEIYSHNGELIHQWEACSDLSDYCSFALAGDYLFVTDAENKNICKYTKDGSFVQFIQSPVNFIIPGYSFDITSYNDTLYCVNSGRHLVESYTLNGDFISAFGGPGGTAGYFAGCCNPVYVSFTSGGKLFTSEKGNPRISRFARDGKFEDVILNSKMLGGGNKAYKVKAGEDLVYVAGKNIITIYRSLNPEF